MFQKVVAYGVSVASVSFLKKLDSITEEEEIEIRKNKNKNVI